MKTAKVDSTAAVEALFWRVHVIDELAGGQDLQRSLYHYVRLKVFHESGRETAATVNLEYKEDEIISSIAGRTIKPDGAIVELKGDAIHDKQVVKLGKLRRNVKSFAMPGVEPGAIVEYRWRETQHNPRFKYARLQFQREYPIQKVTYFVKPLSIDYVATPDLSLWPFNCKPTKLELDNRGYNFTTVENMPPFREEPLMPAEPNVRAWALLFYHDGKKKQPEQYWTEVGKDKYQELKRSMKITDGVKQAVTKALEGVEESQKVTALLRYLRKNVRDLFDATVTDAQRADIIKAIRKDRARTPDEVLKSGIGLASEINLLFAAMATQAGLEARPVLVADRDDIIFDPGMIDDYFLPHVDMAVKQGEDWKLYDATTRRLPPGMVSWREEGMPALLSDPKKPTFIRSPLSPPDASLTKRMAKMALSADGTLSGEVHETYTGHVAAERRRDFERESAERQKEAIQKDVVGMFSTAQVTDIRVENAADGEKPLEIRYHVTIPQYAQVTGKRLFFAPLFFQHGDTPLFESADRKYDVVFRYAWKERDEVLIRMPEGFVLDNAGNPGNLNLGRTGSYKLTMGTTPDNELVCAREFVFGNEGQIGFPQAVYPQLKNAFDEIHKRDTVTIAVRRP